MPTRIADAPIDDQPIVQPHLRRSRSGEARQIGVRKLFAAGDPVRVHSGVLEGVQGAVLSYCSASRLIIAINLTCEGVTLEIDEGQLEFRYMDDNQPWGAAGL